MLQAILNNASFTHPIIDAHILSKATSILSQNVLNHFMGHPNSFAKVSSDRSLVVTGNGPNGEL